jgi:hypothetical protein
LGSRFFVSVEMTGFQTAPARILMEPYASHHQKIAEQKWSILGKIASCDPRRLGLGEAMEWVEADACWKRELDYWEGVLDSDELIPQPVMRAARQAGALRRTGYYARFSAKQPALSKSPV